MLIVTHISELQSRIKLAPRWSDAANWRTVAGDGAKPMGSQETSPICAQEEPGVSRMSEASPAREGLLADSVGRGWAFIRKRRS